MAVERELRQRIQHESVVVKITCDRCGNDLRRTGGKAWGHRTFEGSTVQGDLYPSQNIADVETIEFDLCADCTKQLRDWITAS